MVIERGDEGKRTDSRSGKPDPKAKTLAKDPEKKGAAPPEKPSLTVDEPTLSGPMRPRKPRWPTPPCRHQRATKAMT
jgi:hypothetical protein